MFKRSIIVFSVVCTLGSCSSGLRQDAIILTTMNNDSISGHQQCIISVYNPSRPEKQPRELTSAFWSACSPDISFDGKTVIFSGKVNKTDPWQVWEINLKKRDLKKITATGDDCLFPVWLPDGAVAFSRSIAGSCSLFRCNRDGSSIEQITFDPYSYNCLSVLRDGRILSLRREGKNEAAGILTVLRPDGTKNGLFYKSGEGKNIMGCARETADGRIVFIESAQAEGKITSLKYNRPLHSENKLGLSLQGSFRSVYPIKNGKMLVSYKPESESRFGIYEYDPLNETINPVYADPVSDIIEASVAELRDRPKKLPSEVDKSVKTGLLLCQDVRFDGTSTAGTIKPEDIEVTGVDSMLGKIEAENDGSLYLKILADTPFRLQVKSGENELKQSAWLYLRPNERRGCVGCHENPELVPENRLAMAVGKPPVSIPMHMKTDAGKEIELE